MYRIPRKNSISIQISKQLLQKRILLPSLKTTKFLNFNKEFRFYNSQSNSILESRNDTTSSSKLQFNIGDRLYGYRVDSIHPVPELCLTAYSLTFEKNGAKHLHISRNDSNNVFSVAFRTTPEDSTGVAHILEHLVLCGSQKYPVRDPFMKMLTRSLSTFMNAFTGCDYTMYPFSTQNYKDFYNLMSIYLDAVFYPRLRYLDFLQEGWRLEHSEINHQNSPLVFKGVVFNEMKGAFSSASSIYTQQMINKLFPDNTYRNISGGDPLTIPELSYEKLKNFHCRHYHPSNSRFYTYGNFSLENHLEKIGKIIDNFDMNESLRYKSHIPDQQTWSNPEMVKFACQYDPLAPFPDRQTTASSTWLLKSLQNIEENFTLSILCTLLIDGPNSPFYQALIDSGLGSDYSPCSGYNNFTKQSLFSIGLQGIESNKASAVQKAIYMALMNAYTEGFPSERIEAILHRIELSTKHQTENFGLALLMSINNVWNHDVNPVECLNVNKQVENFRNNLKNDPKYLQRKIKKYFLDNNHKLIIEMTPNQQYEQEQNELERKLLETKISQLNNEDRKNIFTLGQELLLVQNAQEDITVLPTLTINDINRSCSKTNLEKIKIGQVPVQYSSQPTNGLVYFNAVLQLQPEIFPKKLLPYLPLFTHLMTKLGAGKYNRNEFDQAIQITTGGLNSSVYLMDNHSAFGQFEMGIHLNSFCLERNLNGMFQLWTELFNKIHFRDDPDHLMQLIRISSAELAQGVSYQGHEYCMKRAASTFGGLFKVREITSGITSLTFHRVMAASQNGIDKIINHLEEIAKIAFSRNVLRCSINAECSAMHQSLQALEHFLNSNLSFSSAKMNNQTVTEIFTMPTFENSFNEHFIFPFSTNFQGQSIYCVPFSHEDHARLRITASLLTMKFLHKEIREKGGAYGSGAKLDFGGVFYCYSYRDPYIRQTNNIFEKIGEWLLHRSNYRDEDIDEAKLQVFQSVDQPISPGDQGLKEFLTKVDDDMRQEYRNRLLNVSRADIQLVAEKYLLNNIVKSRPTVVLGPKSDETSADKNKWIIRIVSEQL